MAGLRGREGALTSALSAGWRQRLALGCAILHEPPIVFLDEPTGGVDPLSRRRFWRLIDDLARAGVAVLVTTHYLDEAEHCHRIAIIQAGRLAALGTVKELKAIFASRPIVEVRTSHPVAGDGNTRRDAGRREDQHLRHLGARRASLRRHDSRRDRRAAATRAEARRSTAAWSSPRSKTCSSTWPTRRPAPARDETGSARRARWRSRRCARSGAIAARC